MQDPKQSAKKEIIAIFDFDGTITTRDSYLDFFVWSFGWERVGIALFRSIHLILFYRLGFIKNDIPKKKLLKYFLGGVSRMDYLNLVHDFVSNRLDSLIRKEAVERIAWHKAMGHEVIINSASLVDWIEPWAATQKIERVIATRVKCDQDFLSGDFDCRCPYGEEKVRRLLELGINRESYYLYVYGDSRGDKELIAFGDLSEFKPFRGD